MKFTLKTSEKTRYRECILYFQNGIFHKSDSSRLMNYYLYEIANGVHTKTRDINQIIHQLFQARDLIHEVLDNQKFFLLLCESFMIAHPTCLDSMTAIMRAKGIKIYGGDNASISQGDYSGIDRYILNNAKGIKENEKYGHDPYLVHSRQALIEVCYSLEDAYRDFRSEKYHILGVEGFRTILTAGKWKESSFSALEMTSFGDRPTKKLILSDNCTITQKPSKKDFFQYSRNSLELFDSTTIFLSLIYRYTESFVKESMKIGPKKKRTAQKLLGKSLSKCSKDEKEILSLMKEYLADQRFEKGIQQGVQTYLAMHPECLPKKKKKTSKPTLKEQMEALDRGKNPEVRSVQKEQLSKAKSDADYILSVLHLEEVNYDNQ